MLHFGERESREDDAEGSTTEVKSVHHEQSPRSTVGRQCWKNVNDGSFPEKTDARPSEFTVRRNAHTPQGRC